MQNSPSINKTEKQPAAVSPSTKRFRTFYLEFVIGRIMGKWDFSQKRRCGAGPETNIHKKITDKRNWVSQTKEN